MALSVSMIVRDEADTLAAALESLANLSSVDEIVVLDTGSVDDSPEIARALGASVHLDRWQNDFALHRNRCLDLCRNDWVFILDGDERVLDAGDLEARLANGVTDALTAHVRCVREGQVFEVLHSVRAFDRRRGRWKYPVHNQIVGIDRADPTTCAIEAVYDARLEATCERRLAFLLEGYERQPLDPHFSYFIAKSFRALRRPDDVVTWSERYLGLQTSSPLRATALTWLVEAFIARGDMECAVEHLARALGEFPRAPDLLHLRLTLAAVDWYRAAIHQDPELHCVPSCSVARAQSFEVAADLLGLPLQFGEQDE